MATHEIDATAVADERGGTRAVAVREVAFPPSARALTALSRVDYTDAFVRATRRAGDRTGEQWARAMLEDAPAATRRALRRGWFLLGVRLGSADDPQRETRTDPRMDDHRGPEGRSRRLPRPRPALRAPASGTVLEYRL